MVNSGCVVPPAMHDLQKLSWTDTISLEIFESWAEVLMNCWESTRWFSSVITDSSGGLKIHGFINSKTVYLTVKAVITVKNTTFHMQPTSRFIQAHDFKHQLCFRTKLSVFVFGSGFECFFQSQLHSTSVCFCSLFLLPSSHYLTQVSPPCSSASVHVDAKFFHLISLASIQVHWHFSL